MKYHPEMTEAVEKLWDSLPENLLTREAKLIPDGSIISLCSYKSPGHPQGGWDVEKVDPNLPEEGNLRIIRI